VELRTEIQIPVSPFKIDHPQSIYLTGSCFSENILEKFSYYGFNALANSHGIIYNPVSIYESLHDLLHSKTYQLEDLQLNEGKYFSFNHHGGFSSDDSTLVLDQINKNITIHGAFVKQATVIFVTLGTAWVYLNEKQKPVANCHKLPSARFEKDLLSSQQIEEAIAGIITQIGKINKNAEIVFTVSPVKHLKDGFVPNQLSKSLLHTAIQKYVSEKVHYFPAYEIMNDDLRDYRFWKEDMIHPNGIAIDYIWEKLSKTYFNPTTLQIMDEVKKLRQFLDHRTLSNDLVKIDQLKQEKEKKKQELLKKYPQLKL
jgi:hypothetical protein